MRGIMFLNKRGGYTLVELSMVIVISTLIILVIVTFFGKTHKMFTNLEVVNSLKTNGQRELGRLCRIVFLNKRIFSSGSAADLAYLARVDISADPAPLALSKLPEITVSGVLSPSGLGFDPSIFGNSLFLATCGKPFIAIDILDSGNHPHTMRIDTYVFHYYYLNFAQDMKFFAQNGRNRFVGWHSQLYTDYMQIEGTGDNTQKQNLIKRLYNSGYRIAWSPSATDVLAAFYALDNSGNALVDANHQIKKASIEFPLDTTTGLFGWSYTQGIAFNSSATFAIRDKVPLFAAVNNGFPGGLEIGIIGGNTGRQIFIRMVMAAQSLAGLQSYEHISLTTVRDCW